MAFFSFRGVSAAPKVTVVTTMKDEGAYILDWVAHYKSLGATDIVVFTNDCSDPTDHILRTLNKSGEVHHRFNRVMKRGPHKSALMWAAYEPAVQNADWVLVVDVDEYLQIKTGDGTFKALIDANPDVDAISFVWRIFGNADVKRISDTPVPQEFTRAQLTTTNGREQRFFKTMHRNNGKFSRLGVHRPYLAEGVEDVNWITPDGTRFTEKQTRRALGVRENFGYEVAQLNHYALRSLDAFVNKQRRGRANHFKSSIEFGYWNRFDLNDVEDLSLSNDFEKALAVKEELLRDEKLRQHNEAAFAWHRKMALRARRRGPLVRKFLKALQEKSAQESAAEAGVETAADKKQAA